jgi:lactoylglutathione lyase
MNLKIKHIQHIGIPVTDIARSVVFYQQLGFANVMNNHFLYNGGTGLVVMMKSGEVIIELYQLPAKELAEIRNRGNGHIDHIAFDVEDIDDVFHKLKAAAVKIIEAAPVYLPFWEKGCKYFNITGPDGERLEFNQILK